MGKFYIASLIVASFLLHPVLVTAQTAEAPAKPAKRAKARAGASFHGQLESLDRANMTIIVTEKGKAHVIGITSQTRISKNGKPAALSDAAIGDKVSGSLKKGADGKEIATAIRFSNADEKATKPSKPAEPPK